MHVPTQVLHSGDLICEGIIKQQAEPAKAEEPKKEEPAAQEPSSAAAPAQPVPTAGVTANVAVISVSHLNMHLASQRQACKYSEEALASLPAAVPDDALTVFPYLQGAAEAKEGKEPQDEAEIVKARTDSDKSEAISEASTSKVQCSPH